MVIAIIGALSGISLVMISNSHKREQVLEVKQIINNLHAAIISYHSKTLRFPETLRSYMPNSASAYAENGQGYLHQLMYGVKLSKRNGTSLQDSYYSFYEPSKYKFDSDHEGDVWGNRIHYRRTPRNASDFNRMFPMPPSTYPPTTARDATNNFPGNSKLFNLWSAGPDLNDYGQCYHAEPGTMAHFGTNGGEDYRSGGYSSEEYAEDDVGNW